jgi:hypothetical protein
MIGDNRSTVTRLDGIAIHDPQPQPSYCEARFNEFDCVESAQSRQYTMDRIAERKRLCWQLQRVS